VSFQAAESSQIQLGREHLVETTKVRCLPVGERVDVLAVGAKTLPRVDHALANDLALTALEAKSLALPLPEDRLTADIFCRFGHVLEYTVPPLIRALLTATRHQPRPNERTIGRPTKDALFEEYLARGAKIQPFGDEDGAMQGGSVKR
jgi:hypothetical protein